MLPLCLLFASASLPVPGLANSPLPASPDPVVTGNTITVAADGWYQFQRRTDYAEVCAGTWQCTVPSGDYIVINHSTGQRWETLSVPSIGAGPNVQGNTVLLPDDGWYQVQDSSSYESICEGQRSCTVPAGTYHVINLTSGQRFESIVVGGQASTIADLRAIRYSEFAAELFWEPTTRQSGSSVFSVYRDGLKIGETNGSSYFDDTLTANVAFDYKVHTGDEASGVPITVAAYAVTPLLNAANAEQILKLAVSVINEDQIDAFFADAQADLKFQNRRFFLTNTIDEIVYSGGVTLEAPYLQETSYGSDEYISIPVGGEYTCASGGSIYNFGKDRVFNNCVAGNHTYNGTSGRRNDSMRGIISNYPFYAFSATDASGETSSLSGGYFFGNESFVVLNQTEAWENAEFTTISASGELRVSAFNIVRKDNSDIGWGFNNFTVPLDDGTTITVSNSSQSSTIEGSLILQSEETSNLPISINVTLSFMDRIREPVDSNNVDAVPGGVDPKEPFQWQAGSITISADDGSRLIATPLPALDGSFSILLDNGESIGPLPLDEDYKIQCGSTQICGES